MSDKYLHDYIIRIDIHYISVFVLVYFKAEHSYVQEVDI